MPYNLFILNFIFVVYIVVVKVFDRSIFLKSLYVMIYHNRKKALRCTLSLLTVVKDNIDTSPSVLCSDPRRDTAVSMGLSEAIHESRKLY